MQPRCWMCWVDAWLVLWDVALLLVGSAFKVTMYHLKEKLYSDEAWLLAISTFAACAHAAHTLMRVLCRWNMSSKLPRLLLGFERTI